MKLYTDIIFVKKGSTKEENLKKIFILKICNFSIMKFFLWDYNTIQKIQMIIPIERSLTTILTLHIFVS